MLMQEKNLFLSGLQRHFETLQNQDAVHAWRLKGWEHLQRLQLPDKSCGAFQYVPLRELYAQEFSPVAHAPVDVEDFQRALYPECHHSYILFVDGHPRLDLSDLSAHSAEIVLLPLKEAFRSFGNILQSRFHKMLSEEKDPFSALNLALHADALFLFIPPKKVLSQPIQCLHLLTQETPRACVSPRLHIFLGAHAQVRWITSMLNAHEHWFNGVTDLALEEGARFHAVNLIHPHSSSWHFDAWRATVKRDAYVEYLSVTTGSKTVRQDFRVALAGEGAEAKLQGIAMLNGHDHAHAHVLMEHQAPHTRSMQLFKGVLNGVSQSSFEGKIHVHKEAQKTQAYQLNNHLLLGERTRAHSKPNLQIFADDVKASHGSTMAQIDPAQLLYLKTRGIDNALAKQLLISGFCQEILTQIPHLLIVQEMHLLLNGYLRS